VQVSNKLNDGYRFGYNGQEKVDEIAGAGNHTTAEFWEYDTRLGRRWNMDPEYKKMSNESPYAVNHSNPIANCDPKGDFGFIGAALGAAVGGLIEIGSQLASNLGQGKSLKQSFKDMDWADVGISAAEGGAAGATGGLSMLSHGVFAAARVAVDLNYDSQNGFKEKHIFGSGEHRKSWSQIGVDFVSEGVGLGLRGLVRAGTKELGGIGNIIKQEGKVAAAVYDFAMESLIQYPTKWGINVLGNTWVKLRNNKEKGVTISVGPVEARYFNNNKLIDKWDPNRPRFIGK
jgi:hypothetical protein